MNFTNSGIPRNNVRATWAKRHKSPTGPLRPGSTALTNFRVRMSNYWEMQKPIFIRNWSFEIERKNEYWNPVPRKRGSLGARSVETVLLRGKQTYLNSLRRPLGARSVKTVLLSCEMKAKPSFQYSIIVICHDRFPLLWQFTMHLHMVIF